MQIQVIDQQQADPQRLRSMFIVRALRALDRLAPGILKLVGRFRDLIRGETGVLPHNLVPRLALEPLRRAAPLLDGKAFPMEPAKPDSP